MPHRSKQLFESLVFNPEDAVIRLKDRRMLIFDAEAIGVLRAELINTIGWDRAKGILTRFGFACGYNDAKTASELLPPELQHENAGPLFHMMQGHARVDIVASEMIQEKGIFFREGYWDNSYEAEQHIRILGKHTEPVCWTLAGYAAGYNTYHFKEPIIFIEDQCVGKGDARCHVVGRTIADWGDTAKLYLHYYGRENVQKELEHLRDRLHQVHTELTGKYDFSAILGNSFQIQQVIELAQKVCRTDTTVFISGESGTGKELLAKTIHFNSHRSEGPFIAVNCAALPETLLESELFGYERGAFTGAERRKPGRFELASGGTLFLDEVAEMSPAIQVKLLRVLQERKYERVGGTETLDANVRIIAATHENLHDLVEQGKFRDDLYYRLNVFTIFLPPLRERTEDILLLTQYFLEQFSNKMGKEIPGISKGAQDLILQYPWKGNVRELQNALERALILAEGNLIRSRDLPFSKTLPSPVSGRVRIAFDDLQIPVSGIQMEEFEKQMIRKALKMSNGNKSKAAKLLGINRGALRYRLWKMGFID